MQNVILNHPDTDKANAKHMSVLENKRKKLKITCEDNACGNRTEYKDIKANGKRKTRNTNKFNK